MSLKYFECWHVHQWLMFSKQVYSSFVTQIFFTQIPIELFTVMFMHLCVPKYFLDTFKCNTKYIHTFCWHLYPIHQPNWHEFDAFASYNPYFAEILFANPVLRYTLAFRSLGLSILGLVFEHFELFPHVWKAQNSIWKPHSFESRSKYHNRAILVKETLQIPICNVL